MVTEKALEALRQVNFDWTVHLKNVWQPPKFDLPDFRSEIKEKLFDRLDKLLQSDTTNSPLGIPLTGSGGSGKTHLLSVLRQRSFERGAGFVLVDMTDVRDFWETLVQGYFSSLLQEQLDGRSQLQRIIDQIFSQVLPKPKTAEEIAEAAPRDLNDLVNQALQWLSTRDRRHAFKYRDCVRAMILANSNDFSVSAIGTSWLQGLNLEPEERKEFSFTSASPSYSEIAEGISWLMSLWGPTVIAIDQLDAIVVQHHIAQAAKSAPLEAEVLELEEKQATETIIHNIAAGLMGLWDHSFRSLIVVSCLRDSWNILTKTAVSTFRGRFEPDNLFAISSLGSAAMAERLITLRLADAYQKIGFTPPYPSYPFRPDFFQQVQDLSPRALLIQCHQHRERCLKEGKVIELGSLPLAAPKIATSDFQDIEQNFKTVKETVSVAPYMTEESEDSLWGSLLTHLCKFLLLERDLPVEIDSQVDTDFPGGRNFPLLHARLRLIFRNENDREKHLCLRALQRTNPKAFQTRLQGAITASGIDQALQFRRILLVRTSSFPSGKQTENLLQKFTTAGGLHWQPTEEELRILLALEKISSHPAFESWMLQQKPLSRLPSLSPIVTWLFAGIPNQSSSHLAAQPISSQIPVHSENARGVPERPTPYLQPRQQQKLHIFLGRRLLGSKVGDPILLPVQDLVRHTVILAGSGSGKTVLVKRMVEEAALLGIPSIVIDGANDLARMGDPWPSIPEGWDEEDREKAKRYFEQIQVVIWTPGRESGNPLSLSPLPDFSAVRTDPEELDQAVEMARDALQEIVAPGNTTTAQLKRGVLKSALLHFAKHQPGTLEDFIEFLSHLPPEISDISQASKKALEMADLLRAEVVNNSLLRQSGAPLDPATLLGTDQSISKTRIAIINFLGLPSLAAQQQFLNQLAMSLFTWIKKNPAPPESPVRGLLVIDEAKDFVPSSRNTVCKQSILRLAAQARKYGLGLIFSTQAPKSIDHNIIANCLTQFFGRVSSPAAIDVVRNQIALRGGMGDDIPTLKVGQFYVSSEKLSPPCKVQTPLCFSYHAPTPLTEPEILERSARTRLGKIWV